MTRKLLATALAVLCIPQTALRAEPAVIKTDWKGFQEQVAQRKLKNRSVRIVTVSGGEIKANFYRVTENGLLVERGRKTQQWATSEKEATVPRDVISSVRFSGRTGRGGLIGFLAGLGAGAAIAGATAASMGDGSSEGIDGVGVVALIPVFAVAGYFLGRKMDQPAPTFILER